MWERSYSSLAKYFDIPIVGVSNVGEINAGVWQGYRCIGNSLAVAANGSIAIKGKYTYREDSLIITELKIPSKKEKGTKIKKMLEKKGFPIIN